ncbi:MAG: nuclear transport factor 2 family protein [Sphingomonadales bacterium]|jgi:ketosteroid isomerase-like protein|nr:nuclear transport factor 2 family protein [Sphingomonadales bacterium]
MLKSPIARVTIAGLFVLSSAGCHKGGGEHHAAEIAKSTDEAKAMVAGIAAAYNAHDADKAASYDAPDYVGMFHGFPTVTGPAADAASMKQQFLDPAAKFDLDIKNIDVARAGDMVVVRSAYTFSSTDPKTKKIVSETGNWLTGFKRQPDRSLKLVWSIGADTPAAPAPAAVATP